MRRSFYHGSNRIYSLSEFQPKQDVFSLMGAGLYFYEKKDSAQMYGDYVYLISMKGLKIADDSFEFTNDAQQLILEKFGILSNINKLPSGISKPIWWVTEGFRYFTISRMSVVEVITSIIHNMGYDGMLIQYPNGGLGGVVWNWEKIHEMRLLEQMRNRIHNILSEASKTKTKVFHGTSSLNWERAKKLGFFKAPFYVSSKYHLAKEYAIQGGEVEFEKKLDEFVQENYDGDYDAFEADHDMNSMIDIYYELYPEGAVPVILELAVDIDQFDIKYLDSWTGAHTDVDQPISIVKKEHVLDWETIMKEW